MEIVKYIGCSDAQANWGSGDDPRDFLRERELYEVKRREVHSWHTKLELVGCEGKMFNSVCFEVLS